MDTFLVPWRIEAKTSPFHPFIVVGYSAKLLDAVAEAERLKKLFKYTSLRILAR